VINKVVLAFFFVLLTARFFSETISVVPKAFDLIDLVFIPLLAVTAIVSGSLKGVDRGLNSKLLRWTICLVGLAVLSAIVNLQRTHYAPVLLFIFGITSGPVLFLSLNKLIRNKVRMAKQTARFLYVMFIVEGVVVVFISVPSFFASGNPDVVSGTFGLNAYQFSALLIIIGGYFLGKSRFEQMSTPITLGIQAGVILTFLLLQYRTATPAFFASYLVLIGLLYGRRVVRLAFTVTAMAGIAFYAFQYIESSEFDLKFDDLLLLAEDPAMAGDFGKVIAYGNTFSMFANEPITFLVGAGPGTMVSRAAYTFIIEANMSSAKGVGGFITAAFGNRSFNTDVFIKYIAPLYGLESVFGSVQANNPASSILASLAELGIPGLVILGFIYFTMLRHAFRYARFAIARQDPELVPLASALVAGSVYLCLLAPLDNYLEIARVTLPVWLLFWTVSAMVQARKQRDLMEFVTRGGLHEEVLANGDLAYVNKR
jgi:hypothetical protein